MSAAKPSALVTYESDSSDDGFVAPPPGPPPEHVETVALPSPDDGISNGGSTALPPSRSPENVEISAPPAELSDDGLIVLPPGSLTKNVEVTPNEHEEKKENGEDVGTPLFAEPPEDHFEHAAALVITICDYIHLNPLPIHINRDGHDVVEALGNPDIGGVDKDHIIHLKNPTKKEFVKSMTNMKKLVKKGKTTLTVYLAAHCGCMGLTKSDYICCIEADGSRANSAMKGSVKVGWFMKQVASMKARRTVVFFDGWHQGRLQGVTRLHVRRAKRKGNDHYSTLDKNTINAVAYPVSHKIILHIHANLITRQALSTRQTDKRCYPRFQFCCITSCRSPQTAQYGKRIDRNSHFGRHVVAALAGRGSVHRNSILYRPRGKTKAETLQSAEWLDNVPWNMRGVNTRDVYDHVAKQLTRLSKVLEVEKFAREDEEAKELFRDEEKQIREQQKRLRDAKAKVKETAQSMKNQVKEVANAAERRKASNAKAHELAERAGQLAKAAKTPEEFNAAGEADKEANLEMEAMRVLQTEEDAAKMQLNVLRTQSKEDDRSEDRESEALVDLENKIEEERKSRRSQRRTELRRRRFMLNKPWIQSCDYQLFPIPLVAENKTGFFICRWPQPPTTPLHPLIAASRARSLSLTWDTTAFSGAIIDRYETLIRGDQRANSEWKNVRNCDWLPVNVTYNILFHERTKRNVETTASALSPEMKFQFKTRAHNPGGWSGWSDVSDWGRTTSMGYLGETLPFSIGSVTDLLVQAATEKGIHGVLDLLQQNPYTIDLLEGGLMYANASVEGLESGTMDCLQRSDAELNYRATEIVLGILKMHRKSAKLAKLGFKFLGTICGRHNLYRRHVVHLGGEQLCKDAIDCFSGHWKSNTAAGTMAVWANSRMTSRMTEMEAAKIVQKYIRKAKARKRLKLLREEKYLEKLLRQEDDYDPVWS